jgi:predicted nucleic acid-binding Zn ribbon protein
MFCAFCGTGLPADASFCLRCGRATTAPQQGVAPPSPGAKRSRGKPLRLLFMLILILVPIAVMSAVAAGVYSGIDPSNYATAAAYDEALLAAEDTVSATGIGFTLVYLALLTPQVGYRWWDALFLLIPFYGFFFFGRIAWRTANLPYVDWRPRGAPVPAAAASHPAPA